MTTPGTDEPGAEGIARSEKPRSPADLGDATEAATVVNDFGVDLYSRLAGGSSENLVYSPASIAIALAMARAGAMDSTAAEMDGVLHVADANSLPHSMNALTTALDSRTQTIQAPGGDPVDIKLAIANSLWAQLRVSFEHAFLDVLATEYGAGLELVDYANDPDGARQAINAWVNEATADRIPELLPDGSIRADTRLTLVNAIYMKAPWLTPFVKASTAPAAFTTAARSAVQAPTMHVSDRFAYAEGPTWQAIELPYYGRGLSMLIVLPRDSGSLADAVVALATLPTAVAGRQVNLSLPKFDIETTTGLAEVLKAMGMLLAFDPTSADFSGMTTAEQLFIGAVQHQANITVDEEGTEAAAATAVMMRATSAPNPDETVDLRVDRPFVFAIRDNPTGAILFLGHIVDPTQTRG